ncbi:hypothetical protein MMC07_003923 [Pseudocyphellaria aurata]|nr:hypothetical protein [Pseudocyphellaria aurata]
MALNWGVTDVLAVTKLAWDLYNNCYLVAREAPEEFRQLVYELAALQGVLRSLRDDINSDKSFLQRLGDERKQTLDRCVVNCFDTLKKLQGLVYKYRELQNGENLWKKLKWIGKQSEISNLKSKIMAHTYHLNLCMTSIGNSSLNRIEDSLIMAVKRQEEKEEESEACEDELDETTPLTKVRSVPTTQADSVNWESPPGSSLRRMVTGTTLVDQPRRNVSPESSSSISEEDPRKLGTFSHGQGFRMGFPLSDRTRIDQGSRKLPPSPRASEDHSTESPRPRRFPSTSDKSIDKANRSLGTENGCKEKDLIDVVADMKGELSKIRQKEQLQRPLRILRQGKDHQPDDDLKREFQQSVEDELRIRRLITRDWLRVATWWLLKARFNLEAFETLEPTNNRASITISSHGESPANQAYVNLLKASWILHTIILNEDNIASLQMDENRKLFYNLSDGISHEFSLYKPVDTPDKEMLMKQNCDIWELLQPEEENYDDDENELLPGLKNGRWITVDPADAGEEDEKVLFRTFVNAAIGGKTKRIWSNSSPYMVLLSIKDGESEPQVTLSNQSGTLGLSRAFTSEDLQDFDEPTSPFTASQLGTPSKIIPLDFGRMTVAVAFTNENDLHELMRIPRDYFNAVKRREPRQLSRATETLIFKRSVEIFEMLNVSTMKPDSREKFKSCDLRVLETTTKEGWRTTRRLVVSSSAGEKKPWCKEFFLPLSRVQISCDGLTRKVLVKWSDCTHEKVTTDGNYNNIYSYVYDDSNPNIAMSFQFRNSVDAADFRTRVLQLSLTDVFTWSANSNSHFVYDIYDSDPNPKHYKAFQLVRSSFEWTYSELFFMYRDTDYRYDRVASIIHFPLLYYTDYISTHTDKLYKPSVDAPPQFSHCDKRVGNASVEFQDEPNRMAFLSSLTGGYELIFSRRAHYVTTKPPSRFGKGKSNKGQAEVQLWSRKGGNSIRLVTRWWDERVGDKWMSRSVERGGLDDKKDSNRARLPKAELDRGRKIDMANLVARDPKEKTEGSRTAPLTIAFDSAPTDVLFGNIDQEEFAAALDGNPLALNKARSPFDDLMTFE